MTRAVAVARALIAAGVVWGFGAAVVAGLFSMLDASSTISLADQRERVQVVWLGAHAFVACVGVLTGTVLGGTALLRRHLARPRAASALVGATTLGVGVLVALLLSLLGLYDGATLPAVLAGLLIGVSAAVAYLLHAEEPAGPGTYGFAGRTSARTSRSWGSR